MDVFAEMQRRYREGDLPWDQSLPPPEVVDLAAAMAPGRALDLGCGAGRACIYLARHGWDCDGVDFVPDAIALAQARARAAGMAEHAHFRVASVTRLDALQPPYDLALDVGCLHNLRGDDPRAYAMGLARLVRPVRLVRPGGQYLLFAHLSDEADEAARFGMPESTIRATFDATFAVERVERGSTTIGETLRASAWFWMRRTATVR